MKDQKFDQLLSEIRNEHVDNQVVPRLGSAFGSRLPNPPLPTSGMHKLRNCRGFSGASPGVSCASAAGLAYVAVRRSRTPVCRVPSVSSKSAKANSKPSGSQNWRLGAFPVWRWAMAQSQSCRRNCGARNEQRTFPGQRVVAPRPNVDGSLYSVSGEHSARDSSGLLRSGCDEIRNCKRFERCGSAARWIVG